VPAGLGTEGGQEGGGLPVGGMDCEASFVEQLLGTDTDAGEE
jgi:hypothetical protein